MKIPADCNNCLCIDYLLRVNGSEAFLGTLQGLYVDPLEKMYQKIPKDNIDHVDEEVFLTTMEFMEDLVTGLRNYFALLELDQKGLSLSDHLPRRLYFGYERRGGIDENSKVERDWAKARIIDHVVKLEKNYNQAIDILDCFKKKYSVTAKIV